MFYKTGNPKSFRRPFYIGEKAISVSGGGGTPPGATLIAWEFDGNIDEYYGDTAFNWSPVNSYTPAYGTGISGQSLDIPYISGTPILKISGASTSFLFDLNNPWAYCGWYYPRSVSSGVRLILTDNDNNATSSSSNRLWDWGIRRSGISGSVKYAGSPRSILSTSLSLTLDQWHFYYFLYDPNDFTGSQYKIRYGCDGVHYTGSNTSFLPDSPSNPSIIALQFLVSFEAPQVDQLRFYTELKTTADMDAIYNAGAGISLPSP